VWPVAQINHWLADRGFGEMESAAVAEKDEVVS
jgi:hypothetical protein